MKQMTVFLRSALRQSAGTLASVASLMLWLAMNTGTVLAQFTDGQAAAVVLGQPNFTDGSPNNLNAATLSNPSGVAVESGGKVFIADGANGRVLRYTSAASLLNGSAAEAVFGQASFTLLQQGCSATQMSAPNGVAVDDAGNLYVADFLNNRVLRFANAATIPSGSAATAVLGQPDFFSNASATTASGMNFPKGVAVDGSGNLYVADNNNNRVLRFNNAASKPDGAPADVVLGQPDFISNAFATTATGMENPNDVTIDGLNNLYVADTDNNRVLRFANANTAPTGAAATVVLGQPDFTTSVPNLTINGMRQPFGITVSGGVLYVSDITANRIIRHNGAASKTNGASADAVFGQLNFTTSVAATSQSGVDYPDGMAVDGAGNLFVADANNNRVLRFANAALAGNGANAASVLGQATFTDGEPNNPDATSMLTPTAVAVDPVSGKIFVADQSNGRVLRFTAAAALTNGSAAEAVLGQPNLTTIGNAFPATATNCQPVGLAFDGGGNLYVADYINNRVLRYNNAASKANGAAADAALGQPDFTTNTSATTASKMFRPTGVAVDASNNLYVSEEFNHRVLRFANANTAVTGAAASAVLGQTLFTTNASATSQTGMNSPYDVVVDGAGNLYVVERGNNRVLRFNNAAAKPNGSAADGVLGQTLFTTNATATSQTGLLFPKGAEVDAAGNLYIADQINSRVLRFNNAAAKPNGGAADGVLGQTIFTTNTRATTQAGLNVPADVAFNAAGDMFVADASNHRVVRYNLIVLDPEPTALPTTLNFTIGTTTVSGSFTASVPVSDGYIVIRRPTSAALTPPTDGVAYTAGNTFAGQTVIQSGAALTFNDVGLTNLTTYIYDVYSFNGTGATTNYFPTPTNRTATTGNPGAPHTPTLTGNAFIDFYSGESEPSSNEFVRWHLTWDATNLYVGLSGGGAFVQGEPSILYIDADPNPVPTNGSGSTVGFNSYDGRIGTLPFSANFVCYLRTGYAEVRTNTTGAWSGATNLTGNLNTSSSAAIELTIPWSAFPGGKPSQMYFLGFKENGTPGDDAFGVVPSAGFTDGTNINITPFTNYITVLNVSTTIGADVQPFAVQGLPVPTTWTAQPIGGTQTYNSVAATANGAIAVGNNGQIRFTTNNGGTWQSQTSGTTQDLRGIYLSTNFAPSLTATKANAVQSAQAPSAFGTAISCGVGGTILRSTNGGISWDAPVTTSNTNTLNDIDGSDGNGAVASKGASTQAPTAFGTAVSCGVGGTILRTEDGGATFTNNLNNSGDTDELRGVALSNDFSTAARKGASTQAPAAFGTAISCGVGGTILRSTDGGDTWTTENNSGADLNDINWFGNSSQSARSAQTGNSAAKITGSSVQSPSAFGTAISCGVGGTILRSTDGGDTWAPVSSGTTQDLESVYLATETVGYITGANGTILRTTDGGLSWINQSPPTPETLNSVFVLQDGTGFAVGTNGAAFVTLNGGGGDNPLPVELSAFSGASSELGVRLTWSTASEKDNAGFFILRGGQVIAGYESVPQLVGNGTTASATTYAFTDASVEAGRTYTYSLRSQDFSGRVYDYPQTVEVSVRENGSPKTYQYALLQNYPNPFNPSTTIRFTMKDAGAASLKVFDVLGRTVQSETLNAGAGENVYRFDGARLTSGIYFYQLTVTGSAGSQSGSAGSQGAFTQTRKMLLMK